MEHITKEEVLEAAYKIAPKGDFKDLFHEDTKEAAWDCVDRLYIKHTREPIDQGEFPEDKRIATVKLAAISALAFLSGTSHCIAYPELYFNVKDDG